MEEKRYQIFVSSTYEDLKEERMAILNAILDMKHFPAGMEYFSAMDEEQMTFIKRVIDESDYYVLILKARYGSVDKKSGKSYTEQEYDYAIEKGKKVIALIHGNPDKIERDKTDKNERKFKKFIAFQEKVKTNRLIKYWDNMTDLVSKFQTSLYETIEQDTKNGINAEMGWVRGNSIAEANPEIQKKLENLEQENKSLKEKIEKIKNLFNQLQQKITLNDNIFDMNQFNVDELGRTFKPGFDNYRSFYSNSDILKKNQEIAAANKSLKNIYDTIISMINSIL